MELKDLLGIRIYAAFPKHEIRRRYGYIGFKPADGTKIVNPGTTAKIDLIEDRFYKTGQETNEEKPLRDTLTVSLTEDCKLSIFTETGYTESVLIIVCLKEFPKIYLETTCTDFYELPLEGYDVCEDVMKSYGMIPTEEEEDKNDER